MIRPSHIIWCLAGALCASADGDVGIIWAAIGVAGVGGWAAWWEGQA